MNDTPDPSETPPDAESDRFASQNLRTLSDVRRSSDDRIVAGVCAGVARHLNVDPILVRIAVVALTFIGLSGLILYLAAWFLLPEDDADQSVAADWFNLSKNEPQVRAIGLFVAAVLAVVAVVGDGGWGLWWIGWWVLPAAFLFWLFAVRPRQRREEATDAKPASWSSDPDVLKTEVDAYTAAKTAQVLERKRLRLERRRESRALRGLTLSVLLIAEAVTLIVDRALFDVPGSGYVAVAVAVVAAGCLVGTVWGNAGGLIALGLVLCIALLISSAAPPGQVGRQDFAPETAGAVKSNYRHGVGELQLDLSDIDRPAALAGRTVNVRTGIGQTRIYVPDDLPIKLTVRLQAGEINAFGQQWNGHDNNETITDGDGPRLNLIVRQQLGDVEVIRR